MLSKVMKYELRATGRILLPMFIFAVATSILVRLALWVTPMIWEPVGNILVRLAIFVGFFMVIAITILGTVVVVVRFYQSLATDEAYLTFTLPVKASTHILGRLWVGTLFSTLSLLVALLCGWIFVPGFFKYLMGVAVSDYPPTWEDIAVKEQLQAIFTPSTIVMIICVAVIFIIVSQITSLTLYHASIAIGISRGKSRLLVSIIAYFIISNIEGVISMAITFPLMWLYVYGKGGPEAFNASMNALSLEDQLYAVFGIMGAALVIGLFISLLFAIGQYAITHYYFTKKLNLE